MSARDWPTHRAKANAAKRLRKWRRRQARLAQPSRLATRDGSPTDHARKPLS